MHVPHIWITVDVIGTRQHQRVMVHSAAGQRVARPLRRVRAKLGFDHDGVELWEGQVLTTLAEGPTEDHITALDDGLEYHTHWFTAPDDTPVGLAVWLGPGPPDPRPRYNAWILDLARTTTRSRGDDIAIFGDGRVDGEERPIRDLLAYANPGEVPTFLGLYWDALTGEPGLWAESEWSIRPPGQSWIHFWSAARIPETRQNLIHGLTVYLPHRELDTTLDDLTRFAGTDLIMVDADRQIPLVTKGTFAPRLSEEQVAEVLNKVPLPDAVGHSLSDNVECTLELDGRKYTALVFGLPSVQEDAPRAAAIALKPAV